MRPHLCRTGRAAGVPHRQVRCSGRRNRWPANEAAGKPHPTAAGALVQAWTGLWPTVLPGRGIRVAVVRRPTPLRSRHPRRRTPRPPLEAFFTTALTWGGEALLAQSRDRWAVAITLRDRNAFAGLGQDQCRKHERVVGANPLRLLLAATRTLWFVEQTSRTLPCALQYARPWYRQKSAPSQLAIVWACRAALRDAGVFPIPRFTPDLAINQETPEIALPLAA